MGIIVQFRVMNLHQWPFTKLTLWQICTMDDVQGDLLRPPHGTTPVAVIANKNNCKILWKQ